MDALAVVRTMTDTLANYEGLDTETAAELALAVDEACTALIDMAAAGAVLTLTEEPNEDEVIVRLSTVCDAAVDDPVPPALGGFSRRVLEALVDRVDILAEGIDGSDNGCPGTVFGIALTVRR
ncbi:ATP-binding protein [Mycobacterium sp. GA-1841]|uniref:ATP-binding protein n=1 Tax=Mycobacterium sp. GA-1841 TaxID=1834154 RepID=UPI00111591D8|nr:ATP-binding protein [Mycobacterium sp. GA-1841]